MTFEVHSFDNLDPFVCPVDLAFVFGVGSNEESGFGTVGGKKVKES